jgi:hypothetical protein
VGPGLAEQFLAEIRGEFPRFRIVPKAGNRFSRAIDLALRLVTLNGQRRYLSHYHTVIACIYASVGGTVFR